jgi:hypothetical protein
MNILQQAFIAKENANAIVRLNKLMLLFLLNEVCGYQY